MHQAKPEILTDGMHMYRGTKIIHDFSRPLNERAKSRKVVSPYYATPVNAQTAKTRMFYLDRHFAPDLEWAYCNDFANIEHTGWFLSEDQTDTARGIVMTLPGRRGFIPGWTLGEGMASVIDIDIYPDAESAAYAADSLAEDVAEAERQREYEQNCELDEAA